MKTKLGMLASIALGALAFNSCGDDGGSSGNGGGNNGPSGEAVIENKTITGVSQKGPFVNGASVTVWELDGETLAQTGKSFKGKISGDKGEFSVSNVSLASQYALLEANGYYLNENTGAKSNGPIALNALVDLSKRENVNINLLTHLEYERALHLLSTSKGVADAKKQAEGEIFKAFGVTGDFANSEELDILAKGEGDAALLAISVLMQGNLSEAALSERLANFADDIEQDGTWDDAATKAQMADWASTANLAIIRATIEGWNAGNKAPAFEQVVKEFWWNEYGLGLCAVSNDGEFKQNANSLSTNRDVHYVCDNGDWRVATNAENIVGFGCTSSKIGEEKLAYGYVVCSSSGVWSATARTVAGTMTDPRNGGTTYRTTGIGLQMWMAENLNLVIDGSRCYDSYSCAKYGRLYTWSAAMDSATTGCGRGTTCAASSGKVQGICPDGWHLPDTAEWNALFAAVGGANIAGKMLKSTEGWKDNGNGEDAFGFSALPLSGTCGGTPCGVGYDASFWSSSEEQKFSAFIAYLKRDADNAYLGSCNPPTCEVVPVYSGKTESNAVRCVKD